MIVGRPPRLVLPGGPPPGPVEVAAGLLLGHALPFSARARWAASRVLLGEDGSPPWEPQRAAVASGVSLTAVRGWLARVDGLGRQVGAPASVLSAAATLESGLVRAADRASMELERERLTVALLDPRAVVAVATAFGLRPAVTVRRFGDRDLVVPDGRSAQLEELADRVAREAFRTTAVDLARVVQAVPGVSLEVAANVLRADRRFVVAAVCEDCGSAGGGCGAARTWAWRATPGPRGRGTPGAMALRLLAVRSYTPVELHSAVVSAVRRLAPSQGGDTAVPPVGVLVSWLVQQGLAELNRHGEYTQADSAPSSGAACGVSDLSGQGTCVVLRVHQGRRTRVDELLLAAVTDAGGTTGRGHLVAALQAAGYTASAAKSLIHTSPVLTRAATNCYRAR